MVRRFPKKVRKKREKREKREKVYPSVTAACRARVEVDAALPGFMAKCAGLVGCGS